MKDKKAIDAEIELSGESGIKGGNAQLPVNYTAVGTVENDDVRIYIKQSAYKEIEKLAQSDKTKELGSFLIGAASEEMGKTHVVISDIVEAKYTDASVSTLTFTHETWNYVHSEQSRLYPDKKIVGWQHTHPNYGIFLSNYDMFIQENFFNLSFQVAYVIDPVQNIRGFFQWKNGKVQKVEGFYVYDEVGKPVKVEQPAVKKAQDTAKSARFKKLIAAALCVLLLASAALTAAVIVLDNSRNEYMRSSRETQDRLISSIEQQQAQIDEQKDTIARLKAEQSGSAASDDLNTRIDQQQDLLRQQEDELSSMKALLSKIQTESNGVAVVFTKYIVKKGDSLTSICNAYGLDYVSNRKIILSINGIKNEDLITIGQTILLPTPYSVPGSFNGN